jgi:hypothetical protein
MSLRMSLSLRRGLSHPCSPTPAPPSPAWSSLTRRIATAAATAAAIAIALFRFIVIHFLELLHLAQQPLLLHHLAGFCQSPRALPLLFDPE